MNVTEAFEFVEVQKKNAKIIIQKTLLITFYCLYVIGLLILGAVTVLLAPLLAFIPLSLWIIIFLTWRFTNIEYEYSITSGELAFFKIYGSRTRKLKMKVMIRDFETVMRLNDREGLDRLEMYKPQKQYIAVSSLDDEDIYYALFQEKDGTHCVFYFKANDEVMKRIKFYNSRSLIHMKNN